MPEVLRERSVDLLLSDSEIASSKWLSAGEARENIAGSLGRLAFYWEYLNDMEGKETFEGHHNTIEELKATAHELAVIERFQKQNVGRYVEPNEWTHGQRKKLAGIYRQRLNGQESSERWLVDAVFGEGVYEADKKQAAIEKKAREAAIAKKVPRQPTNAKTVKAKTNTTRNIEWGRICGVDGTTGCGTCRSGDGDQGNREGKTRPWQF